MTATRMKKCRRCDEEKTLDEFGVNRARKDGRSSYCFPCARIRSKEAYARNRQWRLERRRQTYRTENPEQYRSRWYKRYSLTPEGYDQILNGQNGVCAICGAEPGSGRAHGRRLAIDHNHSCCPGERSSCGECIRGLICASCNTALGRAMDDYGLLLKMAAYIRAHRSPQRTGQQIPPTTRAGKVNQ